MTKFFKKLMDIILVSFICIVFGLFLSKKYIESNSALITNSDEYMNKIYRVIKIINSFRFIVYIFIGPVILIVLLSTIGNIIY